MNDAVLGATAFAMDSRELDSETALVARAQAREVGAFESLYRLHVGRIHALCRRLAGSQALAEDCTQETFVQAWKALPRFRRDSAFGSWLHRIAVNVVLGHQRAALRRSAWVREDGGEALDTCAAPVERPDVALDLDRAIAELPPGARAVFVLYDIEGHQHEEIAALTGLAVGTCKAHLHRARRLLRARLTT